VKDRRGLTLVELMVVILIAAILAIGVLPFMRRRFHSAKWSEGKSMMGTIATAIRCYHAEVGEAGEPPASLWFGEDRNLGFRTYDFDGNYFRSDDFSFEVTNMNPLVFTVTARHSNLFPSGYTLNDDGIFEEVE
jgi:type IV pilus assembly protein PilA